MRDLTLNALRVTGLAIAGILFFCLSPTYATVATAFLMQVLINGLGMTESWSWLHWIIFSPAIYITWLNCFLIGCAIDLQAWRWLFGYRKHRRLLTSNGWQDNFQFHLMLMNYTRQKIVWSLPLTQVYQGFEGLRLLVLLAGSLSCHVGRGSLLFGFMYDPDLTVIGDGAILGDGSTITGHSVTTSLDGTRICVTAPVVIGPRAVVGGKARIDIGVQIGADAIVEPMSYVPPYTAIGPGEVWGGIPARFVRLRDNSTRPSNEPLLIVTPEMTTASPHPFAHEQDVREILATALHRPIESITPDLTANGCASWDSLGQLGIAAGLQSRFGIVLTTQESLRLKSFQQIQQLLRERLPNHEALHSANIDRRAA